MKKCLIIGFNFLKEDYPPISYSIASILAKFKGSNFINLEVCSFDMNKYLKHPLAVDIESQITGDFKDRYQNKINEYSFIALSAYAWSEKLVNGLIRTIKPVFKGKIILGGYEITALSEEKLPIFYPGADFYIKGYAEIALDMIFKNETNKNILNEPITCEDMVSPYISETLKLNTKKIYWESKRGCPYHCDFCEWGNTGNGKIIRFKKDRIENEINLFKKNGVRCVNVLDPTFLLKQEDVETLEKLLEIPDCEIHIQIHFTPVKGSIKDNFFDICQKHRDRIVLEFGLQTIHDEELKVLQRENDIEHITKIMEELKDRGINYEISIIFGIPGQTVESFRATINFLEENGADNFRAFPLRLPHNSKMKENITALKIKETESPHDFPLLTFVTESCSFTYADWEEMYILANRYSRNKKTEHHEMSAKDIIQIIDRAGYEYSSGGMRGTFACNSAKKSIFNRKTKEKLSAFVLARLQNVEDIHLRLSPADTDNFEESLESILSCQTMRELCAQDTGLAEQVTQDILDFINKTKRQILKTENPFEAEQQHFNRFEQSDAETFQEMWETFESDLLKTYTQDALNMDFYYNEFMKSLEHQKADKNVISFQSVKEHFLDKWGGMLARKKIRWELDIIEEQRKKFCEELYKQIEELKKLQELLEPFTGELGRLWDMSRGRWQKVNFDVLKKYAELLQRDASLRELAEMLGRMRQAEQEFEEEFFADMVVKPEWKAEHAAKAELVGIHESDDISSMLPAEAALLASAMTKPLFYKKFIEKKLQTFEYQAKTLSFKEETFQNKRQKAKEEAKGPFIICIDTSGSMHGTPETAAKTLCFALLKMAVRDNRKCYLISFSTAIQTLNLTDLKNNLDKLIEFLSMSFNGGTDAVPAMQEALRMLETEDYKKADVIMVSDFVMPGFDEKTQNQIKQAKENKTKFHSLVIGDSGNKNTLEEFDSNWVYDTRNPRNVLTLITNLNQI